VPASPQDPVTRGLSRSPSLSPHAHCMIARMGVCWKGTPLTIWRAPLLYFEPWTAILKNRNADHNRRSRDAEETKITKTNIKELFEKAGLVYKEKDGRQIAIIGGKEVDILFGEDGVASTEYGPLTKVIRDHLRKLEFVFSGEKGTSIGKRLLKRCSDTEIKKARTIIDAIIEEREERGKRDKEVNDKGLLSFLWVVLGSRGRFAARAG
jgi:hypothetical protein